MRVLNTGNYKSVKIKGTSIRIPKGQSEQIDDGKLIKFINSHPELSIVAQETAATAPVEEKKKKKGRRKATVKPVVNEEAASKTSEVSKDQEESSTEEKDAKSEEQ